MWGLSETTLMDGYQFTKFGVSQSDIAYIAVCAYDHRESKKQTVTIETICC